MARNLGPDMLANLDNQFELGNIDTATHEARRVEVLELIRRGKAVEYTVWERVLWSGSVLVQFVIGLMLVGGNAFGPILGAGLVVWAVVRLLRR